MILFYSLGVGRLISNKKSVSAVRYRDKVQQLPNSYSQITLKLNSKAMQMRDDFNPETVWDGIDELSVSLPF